MHSKFIEEYEVKNSIIDYDLRLNGNERVMVIYVLTLGDGYFHVGCNSDLPALMQK